MKKVQPRNPKANRNGTTGETKKHLTSLWLTPAEQQSLHDLATMLNADTKKTDETPITAAYLIREGIQWQLKRYAIALDVYRKAQKRIKRAVTATEPERQQEIATLDEANRAYFESLEDSEKNDE